MRKEYRIFAIRLTMVTTFSCAIAMRSAWLVPSCYATTSEAEQEAELKVSLSAEKIIEILRQEPGLLLQVKRMLIQKAYEQGRILESSDLTDDALFHLLREDDVVRALATREVEYRFYVRAKPTRRETESKRAEVDNDQNQYPEPDRHAPVAERFLCDVGSVSIANSSIPLAWLPHSLPRIYGKPRTSSADRKSTRLNSSHT